jgi:ribosomal protein L11 methylase PrmA
MSHQALQGLLDTLKSAVRSLKWQPKGTEWADYYHDTNYSSGAFQHKQELIAAFLDDLSPTCVWDLGANVGLFSRIASERQIPTIAFDIDPAAVEKLYIETRAKSDPYLFPLLLDLTNPSPAIGWCNQERMSLQERANADIVFALALIHHLVIGNNVPFNYVARFFSMLCRFLVIEFVPKTDSQVQRLLVTREDIFESYTQEEFERCFGRYFTIRKSAVIRESERRLYVMETHSGTSGNA